MKKEIFFLIVIFFGIFLGLKFVYSKLVFVPDDPGYPECKPPDLCGILPYNVCINAESVGVGKCGIQGCAGGEPWSKYETNYRCEYIPVLLENCGWIFTKIETWASIADKLEPFCPDCGFSKNGYLAAGSCEPYKSGGFYKVCCNGSVVGSSGPYAIQDAYIPPTEGVCTSGSPKIVSGLDTTPNSGDPHPDCGGVASIRCSSRKIDQDTAQFTANSSQRGTIEISVEGNVIERCTNATSCTADYTGSGTIQATASLIGSSGQTLVSVNCPSVTLGGGAPPPPPPPPASSQGLGGICSPVIVNRIKFPNGNWSQEGQFLKANNPGDTQISKNDTVQLDVKLENRGTTATAKCKYKTCTGQARVSCDYCYKPGEPYWNQFCNCIERDEFGECLEWKGCWVTPCDDQGVRNVCTGWSDEQTETISNPAECSFVSSSGVRSNGVTIKVSTEPLTKFLSLWSNIFKVNPKSIISNDSVILSALDQWASLLVGWNSYINPQRHGYFSLKSEQTSGAIYNHPNVITRSDGSFSSGCVATGDIPGSVIGARNYIACQECHWTGSGWSCPWSGDKGSYTIFDERWPATTDGRVNGFQPLNVEPGRIEFYTQPSDVAPYLSVEKSQAPKPPPDQVKTPLRDWIAGFPFKINYGVNILGPGKFAKDIGDFWFELTGNPLPFTCSISPFQKTNVSDFSTRQTTTCTPQKAGSLTITAKHNADDEKVSINENNEAIGDVESISRTITIYRYLCYQGFCWECPNEPALRGTYLDVKGASCQAVEDAKCKAYINKSCKAGVRE